MASSQTANYKLNQWAASDQFLRTEFNADNQKIENALSQMQQVLQARPYHRTVLYTGDGAQTREIDVGVAGSLALIRRLENDIYNHGGVVTTIDTIIWNTSFSGSSGTSKIRLSGSALLLGDSPLFNYSGATYICVVFP